MKQRLVAICARVSTADQNPDPQLRELRQFARARKFRIYREYVYHVTGTDHRGRDRAFRELMADAGRRRFDVVLVWKYDRFARSLKVLITALQTFSSLGIDFISCTEQIDTTTPMGRLFFNIIGAFAEFDRETIVERVKAGLNAARAKGVILGRPRDKITETRILKLRKAGWSIGRIARKVKRSGSGVHKVLKRAKQL